MLDVAMSAVLSRQDADIDKLLADAEAKANTHPGRAMADRPVATGIATTGPRRRAPAGPGPRTAMAARTVPRGPTPARAGTRRGRGGRGANLTAYGFLFGGAVCFALFSWYPMVRAFILSFQQTNLGRSAHLGGARQLPHASSSDPAFGTAWQNTVDVHPARAALGYAVPFVVALVLNELRHARAYLRFVVYLPVMLPPASALLLFKWFYDPGAGPVQPDPRLPPPARPRTGSTPRHRADLAGHRRRPG